MKNKLLAFVGIILFIGIAIIPAVKSDQQINYVPPVKSDKKIDYIVVGWVKKDIHEVHYDRTYTVVHAIYLREMDLNGQFSVAWNQQVWLPCTMADFLKIINSRPALVGYFVHMIFYN